MSKHILIVHGFLLSGTGSNIYSCNVAMQWKKQNHAVTIFCQDPDAGTYDWVDEFFTKNDELPQEQVAPGKVRVILPDIAGLLPVYQYDEYKGYTTKTIPNFTDEEIERYSYVFFDNDVFKCLVIKSLIQTFDSPLPNLLYVFSI